MAYNANQKSTGLDPLVTLASGDLIIVGDVSDSGRAKAITESDFEDTTGITQLKIDMSTVQGDITTIQGDIINLQNQIDNISTGGGGTGTFDGKIKSFSLEGLVGSPVQNGYQDTETYATVSGTTLYIEISPDFLQKRDFTSDWASATQLNSYVVLNGFVYLLLEDTNTTTYRVYRYLQTNIAAGGTLMTIATQTLGTQDGVMMTSNDTNFYFNYQAGNDTDDFNISKYSIAGTTLTWVADIACGAVAHATDVFMVSSSGDIYGLNTTGTREIKQFDSTGTLQNTYGPYDTNYQNIINWLDTVYLTRSIGDDEAYRISAGTNLSGQFINPSRTAEFYDDFMGGITAPAIGAVTGELSWGFTGDGAVSKVGGFANHPGVVRITGGVGGAASELTLGRNGSGVPTEFGPVNQGNVTIEFLVYGLSNVANQTMFGFADEGNTGDYAAGGAKLALVSKSNVWRGYYVNADAGTINTTAGTVATTLNPVKLKITTNTAGTLATFYVDNVSLGTIALIAGSSMSPTMGVIGSAKTVDIDYFHLFQRLTR